MAKSLSMICRFVEKACSGTVSAILLLDWQHEQVVVGAAPNMPSAWLAAMDGKTLSVTLRSSGTDVGFRRVH